MKRTLMSALVVVLAFGPSVQRVHAQRAAKAKPKPEAKAPAPGAERGASGLWEATIRVGNASFKMALVPAGSFKMGTSSTEADILAASRPVHEVTLTDSYWIGKYPVTQGQWQVVMGINPAAFKSSGTEAPVEQVSWDDIQGFLARLNGVQRPWTFRLPTEAEWEHACRGGSQGERYGDLEAIAWYDQNSGKTPHAVGLKQPNAYGLFDMNGNVWQWCQDYYNDYPKGFVTNPQAAASDMYGPVRVIRGGSWQAAGTLIRSASRNYSLPDTRSEGIGFRLVAVARTE